MPREAAHAAAFCLAGFNSCLRLTYTVFIRTTGRIGCQKFPDFMGSSWQCITMSIIPRIFMHAMEAEVIIRIKDLARIAGSLPPRALGMLLEWTALHQEELLDNWVRARHDQELQPVSPLD